MGSSTKFTVSDVILRFVRKTKFSPQETYGHVYAFKITEISGDRVSLDEIELVLVALKRGRVITGRRMVDLLGRHQKEVRG